jgi:hypothetical protein
MENKVMNGWQSTGDGMEAKVTNKGELMIREEGRYQSNDDYPHFIVSFDSEGNITDYHSSDSRHGDRFGQNEVVAAALAFLRGKGML